MQEGVEVLAGAVDGFVLRGLTRGGLVAREFADVGEGGQHSQFCLDQFAVLGFECAAKCVVFGQNSVCVLAADVVATDHRGQCFQLCQCICAGIGPGSCCGKIELDSRSLLRDSFLTDLVDAQERCAGIDLGVDGSENLTHFARVRSANRGLHLHGFEHDQSGSGFDVVADRDRYCYHYGGSRRADYAGVVLADLVADAVDLDEIASRAHDGNDVEAAITDHQP